MGVGKVCICAPMAAIEQRLATLFGKQSGQGREG